MLNINTQANKSRLKIMDSEAKYLHKQKLEEFKTKYSPLLKKLMQSKKKQEFQQIFTALNEKRLSAECLLKFEAILEKISKRLTEKSYGGLQHKVHSSDSTIQTSDSEINKELKAVASAQASESKRSKKSRWDVLPDGYKLNTTGYKSEQQSLKFSEDQKEQKIKCTSISKDCSSVCESIIMDSTINGHLKMGKENNIKSNGHSNKIVCTLNESNDKNTFEHKEASKSERNVPNCSETEITASICKGQTDKTSFQHSILINDRYISLFNEVKADKMMLDCQIAILKPGTALDLRDNKDYCKKKESRRQISHENNKHYLEETTLKNKTISSCKSLTKSELLQIKKTPTNKFQAKIDDKTYDNLRSAVKLLGLGKYEDFNSKENISIFPTANNNISKKSLSDKNSEVKNPSSKTSLYNFLAGPSTSNPKLYSDETDVNPREFTDNITPDFHQLSYSPFNNVQVPFQNVSYLNFTNQNYSCLPTAYPPYVPNHPYQNVKIHSNEQGNPISYPFNTNQSGNRNYRQIIRSDKISKNNFSPYRNNYERRQVNSGATVINRINKKLLSNHTTYYKQDQKDGNHSDFGKQSLSDRQHKIKEDNYISPLRNLYNDRKHSSITSSPSSKCVATRDQKLAEVVTGAISSCDNIAINRTTSNKNETVKQIPKNYKSHSHLKQSISNTVKAFEHSGKNEETKIRQFNVTSTVLSNELKSGTAGSNVVKGSDLDEPISVSNNKLSEPNQTLKNKQKISLTDIKDNFKKTSTLNSMIPKGHDASKSTLRDNKKQRNNKRSSKQLKTNNFITLNSKKEGTSYFKPHFDSTEKTSRTKQIKIKQKSSTSKPKQNSVEKSKPNQQKCKSRHRVIYSSDSESSEPICISKDMCTEVAENISLNEKPKESFEEALDKCEVNMVHGSPTHSSNRNCLIKSGLVPDCEQSLPKDSVNVCRRESSEEVRQLPPSMDSLKNIFEKMKNLPEVVQAFCQFASLFTNESYSPVCNSKNDTKLAVINTGCDCNKLSTEIKKVDIFEDDKITKFCNNNDTDITNNSKNKLENTIICSFEGRLEKNLKTHPLSKYSVKTDKKTCYNSHCGSLSEEKEQSNNTQEHTEDECIKNEKNDFSNNLNKNIFSGSDLYQNQPHANLLKNIEVCTKNSSNVESAELNIQQYCDIVSDHSKDKISSKYEVGCSVKPKHVKKRAGELDKIHEALKSLPDYDNIVKLCGIRSCRMKYKFGTCARRKVTKTKKIKNCTSKKKVFTGLLTGSVSLASRLETDCCKAQNKTSISTSLNRMESDQKDINTSCDNVPFDSCNNLNILTSDKDTSLVQPKIKSLLPLTEQNDNESEQMDEECIKIAEEMLESFKNDLDDECVLLKMTSRASAEIQHCLTNNAKEFGLTNSSFPKPCVKMEMENEVFISNPETQQSSKSFADVKMSACQSIYQSWKNSTVFKEMLTTEKLGHFFKCMDQECTFTHNSSQEFAKHLKLHIQPDESIETLKNSWNLCAYCCEKLNDIQSYMTHIKSWHGDCNIQCRYCFYRGSSIQAVLSHQAKEHVGDSPHVLRCLTNQLPIDIFLCD